MDDKKVVVRGGMNVFTVTFIVFLVLKLTGHLDWSWWMIAAPLWAPLMFMVGAAIGIGLCFVSGLGVVSAWRGVRRWRLRRRIRKLYS